MENDPNMHMPSPNTHRFQLKAMEIFLDEYD